MPKIEGDKKYRRIVKVYGVEGDVVVILSASGIEFKAKGTINGVFATWPELVKAAHEPATAKARFHRDPFGYLAYQAAKFAERKGKRLEKQLRKEIKEKHNG